MSLIETLGSQPLQHFFDDKHNHCFGCGRDNQQGLQLKSFWNGNKAVASFIPSPEHNGIPGFVYGGLVASLIDCHAMATAAADHVQLNPTLAKIPRFVTGTMTVRYIKPTPLNDKPLNLSATVSERSGRKSIVIVSLSCDDQITAEGNVIAFHIPDTME